jgi:hypothetical protein
MTKPEAGKPHDHRDSWDAADTAALADLLEDDEGLTYREIGERLGRTREAVRSKARWLGLR